MQTGDKANEIRIKYPGFLFELLPAGPWGGELWSDITIDIPQAGIRVIAVASFPGKVAGGIRTLWLWTKLKECV
jgi:hypothetical protein